MLSVRLSKDIESRLDALAARTNRAKSFYYRREVYIQA